MESIRLLRRSFTLSATPASWRSDEAGKRRWRKAYWVASGFLAGVAIAVTFWSPAVSVESRQYKVTVIEQVRHEITVKAAKTYAAGAVALLEARRTSGSPNPAWEPSPPTVLAHVHEANDFAVIDIEPLPSRATPEPDRNPVLFEIDAMGGTPPLQTGSAACAAPCESAWEEI